MITRLCSSFALLLLVSCFSSASVFGQVTIVGYDSTNPNGASGDPSPDLAAAEFAGDINPLLYSRGAGLIPNQGITLNSRDWSTSNSFNASSTDYLEWGWSTGSGQYDLDEMTIQYDRSGSGPRQLVIQLSVDGGSFQSIFSDSNVLVGDETHTIGLSAFDNVSSATFRLFGFDADSSGGTFDIERFNSDPDPSRAIVVSGFAVAVPEPGSAFVICGLSLGLVLRRVRVTDKGK